MSLSTWAFRAGWLVVRPVVAVVVGVAAAWLLWDFGEPDRPAPVDNEPALVETTSQHVRWGTAGEWAPYLPTTTTTVPPAPVATIAEPEPAVTTPGGSRAGSVDHDHEDTSPPMGTGTGEWSNSELGSIRQCESGGDYGYSDGTFDGAYQYLPSTWQDAQATAGIPPSERTATADQASPATQDAVTAAYIDAGNRGAWPSC